MYLCISICIDICIDQYNDHTYDALVHASMIVHIMFIMIPYIIICVNLHSRDA